MISGFNTDVEFDKVLYHVQTEDKGLKSRLIVSLVYDRGTILASKRVSYDDLVTGTFDEDILAKRVQRQHKLICAAVSAGRMGELREMSTKAAPHAQASEPVAAVAETSAAHVPVPTPQTSGHFAVDAPPTIEPPVYQTNGHNGIHISDEDLPAIELELDYITRPDIFEDAPLFEGVSIIEDTEILPAEAVAVVSELSGTERPANMKLSVELLGDAKFKGGDRQTVNIMVCRGTGRKVVAGAEIMIKVLGSSFRPLIFHAKSDNNGLAKIHLQLPHFEVGRAALLVRAMNEGEEIELRRIVTPG